MLRALMEKLYNVEKVIREMEILRKNRKEMLESPKGSTEIKSAFDMFLNSLGSAEERNL
jgi:hypothetical protein